MIDRELRTEIYNSAVARLCGEATSAEFATFCAERSTRDAGARAVLNWLKSLSLYEARERAEWLASDYVQEVFVFRRLLFLASDRKFRWNDKSRGIWTAAACIAVFLGLAMTIVSGMDAIWGANPGRWHSPLWAGAVTIGAILEVVRTYRSWPRGNLGVWPFFAAEEYEQVKAACGDQVRRDVDKITAFARQTLGGQPGNNDQPPGMRE